MRAIVATSTGFHLRHLAVQFRRHGWDVEFHSCLPRWKTRQYGLPDSATVSHFLPLLPWSLAPFLRMDRPWLTVVRERLAAAVDRRIAKSIGPADLFVGLSSVSIESAQRARELGAYVLIERGSSHVRQQHAIANEAGMRLPSQTYVSREEASYEVADKIVLLSAYAKDSFERFGFGRERIEVVPLGTDLGLFKPPAIPRTLPVKALVVGVWCRRKGSDLIVPLLDAIPELTVTHVGSLGDMAFPSHPRLKTIGHRNHDELAAAMQEHHLLLFPSRDDGFGMVMAEALASGMRVVASRASGGPELAELIGSDYVTLVEPGSIDELIAATGNQLAEIARDPAGAAAPPESVVPMSWDGYGDRYIAMVKRLMDDRA